MEVIIYIIFTFFRAFGADSIEAYWSACTCCACYVVLVASHVPAAFHSIPFLLFGLTSKIDFWPVFLSPLENKRIKVVLLLQFSEQFIGAESGWRSPLLPPPKANTDRGFLLPEYRMYH